MDTSFGHLLKTIFISKLISDLILKRKLNLFLSLAFVSFKDKHSSLLKFAVFKGNVLELYKLNIFSVLNFPLLLFIVTLQVLFGITNVGVTTNFPLFFPSLSTKSVNNL